MHSRPMPFQQRTNTSCYLAIPTRGFTAVLSVFWGTPPPKPLDCKIRLNSLGALVGDLWADPPAGKLRSPAAFFVLCQVTSSRRQYFFLTVAYLSFSGVASYSVLHG